MGTACALRIEAQSMSAVRVERLLRLARLLDEPFRRAYLAGDVDGMDRALERSRAVSAALAAEVKA